MTRFRHARSGPGWLPTDADPDARFYTSDRGVTLTADSTTTRHRVGFRSRDIGITTSLEFGIDNAETTFTVTSAAMLPQDPSISFKIMVDDEEMDVIDVDGTTIEVDTRGAGVVHDPGAPVVIVDPYDGQGFVRLRNGRYILAGGALGGHHELLVNTLWYSDDCGRTWGVLVPNDPDDVDRPAPGHTFGFLTIIIEGTEWLYWIGGDPFAPTGNVFRSSDGGLTWELKSTTCQTSGLALFMYGAIGTDLYVIGGQTGPLSATGDDDESDIKKEVWVSTNYGETWIDNETDCPEDVFGTQVGPLPFFDGGLWVAGSGEFSEIENNFSNAIYKFDGTAWAAPVLANGNNQIPKSRYHSLVVRNNRLWRFNGSVLHEMLDDPDVSFEPTGPGPTATGTITREDMANWEDGFIVGRALLVKGSADNDQIPFSITAVAGPVLTVTTIKPGQVMTEELNAAGCYVSVTDSDTRSALWTPDGDPETWERAFTEEQLPWDDTHAQAAIATHDGIYLTEGFQSPNLYVIREHTGMLVEEWADTRGAGAPLLQADDAKKPILDPRAFPGRPGLVFTKGQVLTLMSPDRGITAGFYEAWAILKTVNFAIASTHSENPPCVVVGATNGSSWNNFGLNGPDIQYNEIGAGGWTSITRPANLNDERVHVVRVLHRPDPDGGGDAEPDVQLFVDGELVEPPEGENVLFDDVYTGWDSVGAGAEEDEGGEFVLGVVVVRVGGDAWGETEMQLMLRFAKDFG